MVVDDVLVVAAERGYYIAGLLAGSYDDWWFVTSERLLV